MTVSWVLSLLLVFAQTGAVLHELGHLSHSQHASGASVRADPLHDSAVCPTCESFAPVASPASGGVPSLPVYRGGFLPIPEPCYAIVGADTPTPRSRGPPQA
ncbi:MAG: hypothetical protein ACRETS_06915 [Steroidobacteraceae bacterium]